MNLRYGIKCVSLHLVYFWFGRVFKLLLLYFIVLNLDSPFVLFGDINYTFSNSIHLHVLFCTMGPGTSIFNYMYVFTAIHYHFNVVVCYAIPFWPQPAHYQILSSKCPVAWAGLPILHCLPWYGSSNRNKELKSKSCI